MFACKGAERQGLEDPFGSGGYAHRLDGGDGFMVCTQNSPSCTL